MNSMSRRAIAASVATLLVGALGSTTVPADAYVRGGYDRPANVQGAHTDVGTHNYDANRNVNVNQNVNVNRNVNVNDYGHAGGCWNCNGWGHPVAGAVAVTATAVAIGTVAASLPPSGCTAISVGGIGYQKCGPNYYQPSVNNSTTQYVVVNPPQ